MTGQLSLPVPPVMPRVPERGRVRLRSALEIQWATNRVHRAAYVHARCERRYDYARRTLILLSAARNRALGLGATKDDIDEATIEGLELGRAAVRGEVNIARWRDRNRPSTRSHVDVSGGPQP